MGDVDGRRAELVLLLDQLVARRDAECRIQVGEGLVEEKYLWAAHDGAAEGDALALAAGERMGLARQEGR